MPQALLGWELGGGLGHFARLRPIAARLLAAGWKVHLASPRRGSAACMFRDLAGRWPGELTLGPAPRAAPAAEPIATDTLADVLALHGYGETDRLLSVAAGWQRLLDRLTPELIVADYTPALCLVARGQARLVTIGSGFTVPPLVDPLPPIRPWDEAVPDISLERERRVLAVCTAIARANGLQRPECVAALLHGDATFPCCLPLLDPYGRRRMVPTHMAYADAIPRAPVPWGERPSRSVLVYLPDQHPLTAVLGQCLTDHLRPASPAGYAADLSQAVAAARLVVHHGGLGTAQAALLAGTPQLILPTHLEDHITARALTRLGVAVALSATGPTSPEQITQALRVLRAEPVATAALSAARAARSMLDGGDTLDAIMAACPHRRRAFACHSR